MSTKAELVTRLMDRGSYRKLCELLLGISNENIGRAFDDPPPLEVVKIISAVRSHLQFLDRYGEGRAHVIENGVHHFAFPDEFSRWLEIDAPGLTIEELIAANERAAGSPG